MHDPRAGSAYARQVRQSRRWTDLSRQVRRQATRCAVCGDPKGYADLTVDHIVPLADDPARAYDPTNVRAVCRPCHRSIDPAFGQGYRARG